MVTKGKEKFILTFTLGGTRRIATPEGKSPFLTKSQAEAIKKRLKGNRPRIIKVNKSVRRKNKKW